MVRPVVVGVATKTSTRPGTPPIAYVRATESIVAAIAERTDCSPANTTEGSALFSRVACARAGCVARRGATGIPAVV